MVTTPMHLEGDPSLVPIEIFARLPRDSAAALIRLYVIDDPHLLERASRAARGRAWLARADQ
jgi:hypothetical protein